MNVIIHYYLFLNSNINIKSFCFINHFQVLKLRGSSIASKSLEQYLITGRTSYNLFAVSI